MPILWRQRLHFAVFYVCYLIYVSVYVYVFIGATIYSVLIDTATHPLLTMIHYTCYTCYSKDVRDVGIIKKELDIA